MVDYSLFQTTKRGQFAPPLHVLWVVLLFSQKSDTALLLRIYSVTTPDSLTSFRLVSLSIVDAHLSIFFLTKIQASCFSPFILTPLRFFLPNSSRWRRQFPARLRRYFVLIVSQIFSSSLLHAYLFARARVHEEIITTLDRSDFLSLMPRILRLLFSLSGRAMILPLASLPLFK